MNKFLSIILILLSVNLFAQKNDYYIQHWTTNNGLPQNVITGINQTEDGFIWISTMIGLVRFDGVMFSLLNSENSPGLSSNRIYNSIPFDKNSLILALENGEMCVFNNGNFTSFKNKIEFNKSVFRILGREDDINDYDIVFSRTGIKILNKKDVTKYFSKYSWGMFYLLSEDVDGSLWFIDDEKRIANYKEGFIKCLDLKTDAQFLTIIRDKKNNLWINTLDKGVFRLSNNILTNISKEYGVPKTQSYCIGFDQYEDLLIGFFKDGIGILKDNKFNLINLKNEQFSTAVIGIFLDRENNIWVGTNGDGLYFLKKKSISNITKKDGLISDQILSIFKDKNNKIWVGTNGVGISTIENDVVRSDKKANLPFIWTIGMDSDDNYLFGAAGNSMYKFDGKNYISISEKDGLNGMFFRVIYNDSKNNIWIGNSKGLIKLKDNKYTTYTEDNGLVNNFVISLLEDRKGTLWIGTNGGGISTFKDGKFINYSEKDGLSNLVVRSIYQDKFGEMWFGTYGGGLNRLVNGRFIPIKRKDGLFDNVVHNIIEDEKGSFWMSCNRGIFRVKREDLINFTDGKIKEISSVSYGKDDGMMNEECNGGFQPSVCKLDDGKLLYPTLGGIAIVDPTIIKSNINPPPIKIEQMLVDDSIYVNGNSINISPGKKRIEIRFTTPVFSDPDMIRFKYKLEGLDDEWISVGQRRSVFFNNLSWGKYKFLVKVCNSVGFWDETYSSIEFNIKPFFYQTIWFYVFSSIVLLFSGISIYKYRSNQIKRHQIELENLVNARTVELNQELQERIKTEQALTINEQNFRMIFESNPLPLILTHFPEPKVLMANTSAVKFFEVSSEQAVQNLTIDFYANQKYRQKLFDLIEKDGKVDGFLLKIKTLTGVEKWTLISALLTKYNNERVLIAGFIDIEKQKQTENELSQSKKFLSSINDSIPVVLSYFDKEKRYIYVNHNYEKWSNRSAKDIIGKSIKDVLGNDVYQKINDSINKVLNGENVEYEDEYLYPDGAFRFTIRKYIPDFDIDGSVKGVISLAYDISERRSTELKMKESEELYRSIIQTLPDAMFIIDLNEIIIFGSHEGMNLIGAKNQEEIIGNRFTNNIVPEDEERLKKYIKNKFNNTAESGTVEFKIINNKGKIFDIAARSEVLRDIDGKPKGLVIISRDITSQKINEKALINAREEAERANIAKSEFLSNMSHEIRTPMNAILGFTEILLSKEIDFQKKSFLNTINSSGQALLTLINDILDLSKIESGKLELNLEPLEIKNLVNEISQIFSQKIQEKKLSFLIDIDSKVPPVLILDEIRLRQILLNLVGNAIKFTEDGFIRLFIKCSPNHQDDVVELFISVQDSGIGIPKNQQEIIFNSFIQQSGLNTKKYGGTGLGLTITKKLVEKMKGELQVESEVNKGTTFLVILPKVKISRNENLLRKAKQEEYSDLDFKNSSVLVVDDVFYNRLLIKSYLSKMNLRTFEAESGEEALKIIEETRPDLILMDVWMSGLNGYEVSEKIKDNSDTTKIPIIAISASAIDNFNKEGKKIFDGYLQKPISKNDLIGELKKYLLYEYRDLKIDQNKYVIPDSTQIIPVNKENIELLLEVYQSEILPQFNKLEKVFVMSEINSFVSKLKELSLKFKINILDDYVRNLEYSMKSMKIVKTKSILKILPSIFEKIKQSIGD